MFSNKGGGGDSGRVMVDNVRSTRVVSNLPRLGACTSFSLVYLLLCYAMLHTLCDWHMLALCVAMFHSEPWHHRRIRETSMAYVARSLGLA